jgi:hypothetical protein
VQIFDFARESLEDHLVGEAWKECHRRCPGERDAGGEHVHPNEWIPVGAAALQHTELVETAPGIGTKQPAPAEHLHLQAGNPRVRPGGSDEPCAQFPELNGRQVALDNDEAVDVTTRGIECALSE